MIFNALITKILLAFTGVLVGVCVSFKLREFEIDPLRALTRLKRRPGFELALLLFFAAGLIQYGATKGTGGGDRSAGEDSRVGESESSESATALREDAYGSCIVTNLCFTSISLLSYHLMHRIELTRLISRRTVN